MGAGRPARRFIGTSTHSFSGGRLMKKVMLVISSIAVLFASGCATKGYVKTQVDPVSDRIGRIEARMNAAEGKLDQSLKDAEASKAQSQVDRAAIGEATV